MHSKRVLQQLQSFVVAAVGMLAALARRPPLAWPVSHSSASQSADCANCDSALSKPVGARLSTHNQRP